MKIETAQVQGRTLLNLEGRLTLTEGSGELRQIIRGLADASSGEILLNMQNVDYIDSTGIDCLIASYVTATRVGGGIGLIAVQSRVRHLLDITKLDTVFPIYPDLNSAIAPKP
ncbi:MAG: STAS domain-containing protein [Acidobacteriota bacterium]|nr:MAG: STAS domain-containing protein [Acidobacteriota bacterium]